MLPAFLQMHPATAPRTPSFFAVRCPGVFPSQWYNNGLYDTRNLQNVLRLRVRVSLLVSATLDGHRVSLTLLRHRLCFPWSFWPCCSFSCIRSGSPHPYGMQGDLLLFKFQKRDSSNLNRAVNAGVAEGTVRTADIPGAADADPSGQPTVRGVGNLCNAHLLSCLVDEC